MLLHDFKSVLVEDLLYAIKLMERMKFSRSTNVITNFS